MSRASNRRHPAVGLVGCLVLAAMTFALALFAMKTGSLDVSWGQLFSGLFISYDETVALIYNLRFPRILVALMAGADLAVSGLLLQAALRNPLADPGIIGISGGAAFVASLITTLVPTLFFSIPIFAFLGGVAAYLLIYALAWRGSLDPVRIILVGVAVAAVFTGLTEVLGGMSNASGVSLSVSGLMQLEWSDVKQLAVYSAVGLVAAALLGPACNLMALEDETIRGLGHRPDLLRLAISGAAVLLCAAVTAVVGVIGFLALLAPHMARRIVGSDHRILLPFTLLLGAFILLAADTLGRLISPPYEISAAVLMNIIGGPCFIILLRREAKRVGG